MVSNQSYTREELARQAARRIGPGLIFWFFCIKAKEQKSRPWRKQAAQPGMLAYLCLYWLPTYVCGFLYTIMPPQLTLSCALVAPSLKAGEA